MLRRGPLRQGRWLDLTDDDCLPEPGWQDALAAQLVLDPNRVVGGHTINHLADNPFPSARQLLIDCLYGHYSAAGGGEAFLAIGGFHESYTRAASEDRQFCSHCLQRGYRLDYEPSARVRHAHHLGATGFWCQYFNCGRGARRYHLDRSERGQVQPHFEPLAIYVALIFNPWRCRVASLGVVTILRSVTWSGISDQAAAASAAVG